MGIPVRLKVVYHDHVPSLNWHESESKAKNLVLSLNPALNCCALIHAALKISFPVVPSCRKNQKNLCFVLIHGGTAPCFTLDYNQR